MPNKNPSVGILGAGISGLCAAYVLGQQNIKCTVYEKSDEVGGVIRTFAHNGWMVEEGPNTLMVKSDTVWDLLEDLGLGDQIIEANQAAKKRFIVKDGQPETLPTSISGLFRSNLLSTVAKFRLLKEPFAAASEEEDESVAQFIERRLGPEPLDYGVNPFVSGIYAGDPKSLSVRHTFSSLWEMEQSYGSLLEGIFKRDRSNSSAKRALISFKKGNQQLPKTLVKTMSGNIRTSTQVQSIQKHNEGWKVTGIANGGEFETQHDCLISTIPAQNFHQVFESDLSKKLAELPYAPLSVLALGFKESQISHPLDGFGMLVPEVENLHFLGSLFPSTLFPGRVPDGHQLLTCFIGGARQPEIATKSTKELESLLIEELDKLIGIKGKPAFIHHKYWPRAIPQYEVGYDYYLSLMTDIEKENPGLYLDGNIRGGVSVPDCISSAIETAQKAASFLQHTH